MVVGVVMLLWPRPWAKKVPQEKKSTNWKWLIPDKQVRYICLFLLTFYTFVFFPILFKFTATIIFIGLLALGFWNLKDVLDVKSI
jgi:hypothetical protein